MYNMSHSVGWTVSQVQWKIVSRETLTTMLAIRLGRKIENSRGQRVRRFQKEVEYQSPGKSSFSSLCLFLSFPFLFISLSLSLSCTSSSHPSISVQLLALSTTTLPVMSCGVLLLLALLLSL